MLRSAAPPRAPAEQLAALVRQRTVSSDPAAAGQLRAAARGLAQRLARAGLTRVWMVTPARHPIVVAEHRHAAGRPTALLYAHYDVQPPGPAEQWSSPPFEPTLRGDDLYGRGASDDKGQLLCHLLALESLLRRRRLPVNVVVVLDGEEEIGSPGLPKVLRWLARRGLDAALISDTRMLGPGRPALTLGLRGSLAVELELRGPGTDLHSGAFGGAVHNPLQGLCEVIAALHGDGGRIAIPGVYESLRAVPRTPVPPRSDGEILGEAHVARGWGELGYNAYERTVARPALTVNGLTGGHQGPGPKSVIPARASAKLSFRLVPDQSPGDVERALRGSLARLVPPTLAWRLTRQSTSRPVLMSATAPAQRAAALAVADVWGRPPVRLRSGGSIAAAEVLAARLGVPTVLLGFALPDDRAHGPDEKFHLPHLELGAATVARFLFHLDGVTPR